MHAQDFYLNPDPKREPVNSNPIMISAGQTMFQFFDDMEKMIEGANPEDKEVLIKLYNQAIDDYYGVD